MELKTLGWKNFRGSWPPAGAFDGAQGQRSCAAYGSGLTEERKVNCKSSRCVRSISQCTTSISKQLAATQPIAPPNSSRRPLALNPTTSLTTVSRSTGRRNFEIPRMRGLIKRTVLRGIRAAGYDLTHLPLSEPPRPERDGCYSRRGGSRIRISIH